ncbi:MAG: acyl-CoA dehydrogenase family protein [Desertimonas sp.]
MAWDFSTPPELDARLRWVEDFVRDDIELVDHLVGDPRDLSDPVRNEVIRPLQARVKEAGLWAIHVPEELGGGGAGAIEVALINEILGRSTCAPTVFGCQSPDAGNLEILGRFGSDEIKRTYMEPLVNGEIVSAFSATEPQGGSDPTTYRTTAVADGDEYVINGEKWMVSGGDYAAFHVVMAITDPDAGRHRNMSLFVVPRETPGVEVIRNVHEFGRPSYEHHSYLRYHDVRVPARNMLGPRGDAFGVMQARMGIARLLLGMRSVGAVRRAIEMMCERVLSRSVHEELLAEKQLVQAMIAESWIELEQFRLLVLQAAWKVEQLGNTRALRTDVSATKVVTGRIMQRVAQRAIQVHGSLGVTPEVPFVQMLMEGLTYAIGDGPTEVHLTTVARDVLKGCRPTEGMFPSQHSETMRARAEERFADALSAAGVQATR